jgi:hypothetical protein
MKAMSKSLPALINETQSLIKEIRQHPDFKTIALNYSPDLTIADAQAALTYLEWEISTRTSINLSELEAFTA